MFYFYFCFIPYYLLRNIQQTQDLAHVIRVGLQEFQTPTIPRFGLRSWTRCHLFSLLGNTSLHTRLVNNCRENRGIPVTSLICFCNIICCSPDEQFDSLIKELCKFGFPIIDTIFKDPEGMCFSEDDTQDE